MVGISTGAAGFTAAKISAKGLVSYTAADASHHVAVELARLVLYSLAHNVSVTAQSGRRLARTEVPLGVLAVGRRGSGGGGGGGGVAVAAVAVAAGVAGGGGAASSCQHCRRPRALLGARARRGRAAARAAPQRGRRAPLRTGARCDVKDVPRRWFSTVNEMIWSVHRMLTNIRVL
ncbi:RNA lariat debranching enzyme [Gracilaria domingensis]|nr:RNA lariat debranching enzyme [Gracilaria domingensis]